MSTPVFVIFNPQSGKGRGRRRIEPVRRAFDRAGVRIESALTQAAGDEMRLAREAVARGHRTIVAVGGDGTWSNVAQALLETGESSVRLGFVPGGTGCDFIKSLGMSGYDPARCVSVIVAGHERTVDVGQIEQRHFLNIAGFGFDVAVLENSWRVRRLPPALVYPYCALRQMRAFPGFAVDLTADGVADAPRRELLMLIVANARVFGGGFRIAPNADLSDGRLQAISFGNMPFLRRIGLMVRLMRGTHQDAIEVRSVSASEFRLRFDRAPAYEADGEWFQARSAEVTVRCRPRALRVLVPKTEST